MSFWVMKLIRLLLFGCRSAALLDSQDHADINFYINSPGGSVYDGLAILDTMHLIKSDVATYGDWPTGFHGCSVIS